MFFGGRVCPCFAPCSQVIDHVGPCGMMNLVLTDGGRLLLQLLVQAQYPVGIMTEQQYERPSLQTNQS